jgi:hypothetical protein
MSIPAVKLTNPQKLEAVAIRPLPPPFGDRLESIKQIVSQMRSDAEKIGVIRKFTPDGRFLGDLGEVVCKVHFGVSLHPVQAPGQDDQSRHPGTAALRRSSPCAR